MISIEPPPVADRPGFRPWLHRLRDRLNELLARPVSKQISSAAHTLSNKDDRKLLYTKDAGGAYTITIPADAIDAGFENQVLRYDSDTVTFSAAGGVTINGDSAISAQWKRAILRHFGDNVWVISEI